MGETSRKEGKEQTSTHNFFLWEDPSFDIREWHVYRFDWYTDRVEFYIDGINSRLHLCPNGRGHDE